MPQITWIYLHWLYNWLCRGNLNLRARHTKKTQDVHNCENLYCCCVGHTTAHLTEGNYISNGLTVYRYNIVFKLAIYMRLLLHYSVHCLIVNRCFNHSMYRESALTHFSRNIPVVIYGRFSTYIRVLYPFVRLSTFFYHN
jgi:hypothetical protein